MLESPQNKPFSSIIEKQPSETGRLMLYESLLH